MKSFRKLSALFACLTLSTSIAFATDISVGQSLIKKRVLGDLDTICNIFEVKYAPKRWKEEFANWDLTQSIEEAKNKISSHPCPTIKECQIILRDFFNSTKDYHVGARFHSTESAALPFVVKGAQGRYFVCYVDREQISYKDFPFDEQDEILTFANRPIGAVIDELRIREYGSNTIETDQLLAEMSLTHRRGDLGHCVPSGNVEITGIKKGDTKTTKAVLNWNYIPEKIRDFSKIGVEVDLQTTLSEGSNQNLSDLINKTQFFEKFMVTYLWDKSYVGAFTNANKHTLGARTSFVPPLGKKTWKTAQDSIFDAYIFETKNGKKIGYIRIPHYIGAEEEVEEFGQIMNYFQKRTDALVLDQVNNPGGSIFYVYALLSIFTDKPLQAPKHRIAMTQEEVYVANYILPFLEQVNDDETARLVLGDTVGGYPVDYRFVMIMKQFCHFLIEQWESGKLYSDPTFLFGVDEIQPHPKYRYTKPILTLTNSGDFSGADFLAAIFVDNQGIRPVKTFGTRTAGAGGYVVSIDFPNHSGLKGFTMTGSLAERIDKRPIENLGVRPDIQYELSVIDLQENYREYAKAIVEAVESLVRNR